MRVVNVNEVEGVDDAWTSSRVFSKKLYIGRAYVHRKTNRSNKEGVPSRTDRQRKREKTSQNGENLLFKNFTFHMSL